jgi:transposase
MSNYNKQHRLIHELAEDDGLNAKQIAERLHISAKTVRRHLKTPRYSLPEGRAIPRKLDPYKNRIKELLERQDYTAVQIFRMIKEEGYPGCESVLRDYVSQVRPRRQTPYLTLNFEPGESAQVDFAECGFINVGEKRRKLYAFVMSLCYSRMIFVKFIMRQNMEHFLHCHREAFEYFQGVTKKVMVDNCKVAVKTSSTFGAPLINDRYADCAGHYGFKVAPCAPRRPNQKGVVERNISYLKNSFLRGLDTEILTLSALNHGVRQWMENVANVRVHGTTRKAPVELFEKEKTALQGLPLFPYDCGVIKPARANSQYRVAFESNKYSVPPEFAGKNVELIIYPENILIRHEGQLVAEHARSYEEHCDCGLQEHDKVLIEQRRKAEHGMIMKHFMALGPIAETYYKGMQARRLNPGTHVKKIMALLSVYGSNETVRALEDGAEAGAFGSDYIANILEARQRILPKPGPLHLSRKSDYLDIELEEPDMDAYDVN